MPSCTPSCLLFRPCQNFSDCGNFSDHVPFPRRNFSHHVGIFPTMSEFFPIPILYAGKNPLLVDGRAPRSIWCKKTLWVAVKIFLSLLRESSFICKAISRKSAETFSFFLQCRSFGGKTTKAYCSLWAGVVGFCSLFLFSLLTGGVVSAMKWRRLRKLPPSPQAFITSGPLYKWRIWFHSSPRWGRCFLTLASPRHDI